MNYIIKQLPKENSSFSRNPNSSKYYISSCQDKITKNTPTTKGWIEVLESLKIAQDYDKSRVLKGIININTHVIVKIGGSELKHEYEYGLKLKNIKGFVKYICYFSCKDNFRKYTGNTKDKKMPLCNGIGNTMSVIVMPYFELGSIASYKWSNNSLNILKSCLKHALLSMITAFFKLNIIHGDFHIGNILLKKTSIKEISYNVRKIGIIKDIPTNGIRTWIMDFENSKTANYSTKTDSIMSIDKFYFDSGNFFINIPLYIKSISIIPNTIYPISQYFQKLNMQGKLINITDINNILELIDSINIYTKP